MYVKFNKLERTTLLVRKTYIYVINTFLFTRMSDMGTFALESKLNQTHGDVSFYLRVK